MTRLPTGSRSRWNPSPAWKRMGGVDRSTSSTNPGRGGSWACERGLAVISPISPRAGPLFGELARKTSPALLSSQVEHHLDRPAVTGVGGVVDGLTVAVEGVGSRDQAVEASVGDQLEGEVEGAGLAL